MTFTTVTYVVVVVSASRIFEQKSKSFYSVVSASAAPVPVAARHFNNSYSSSTQPKNLSASGTAYSSAVTVSVISLLYEPTTTPTGTPAGNGKNPNSARIGRPSKCTHDSGPRVFVTTTLALAWAFFLNQMLFLLMLLLKKMVKWE